MLSNEDFKRTQTIYKRIKLQIRHVITQIAMIVPISYHITES